MHGYAGVDSKVTGKKSYLRDLKETFFKIYLDVLKLNLFYSNVSQTPVQ